MDELKNILGDDKLTEAILNRLSSFGYTVKDSDAWAIAFAIQSVQNSIKNSCNVTTIPDGLFHVLVDRSCGEFLYSKKQSGQLDIAGIDLSGAVKQISEGDTSVTFADGTSDEQKFSQLLGLLLTKGEGDLVCYRKLAW